MAIQKTEINQTNLKTTKNIEKNNKKRNVLATTTALTVDSFVPALSLPFALASLKGMKIINGKLNGEEKAQIKNAAQAILDNKGLAQKGVKLNDFRSAGFNFTDIPDKMLELINPLVATANGSNAFFGGLKGLKTISEERTFINEVVCNMEKLPAAIFHEIGHSFNANKSAVWKAMQSLRTPAIALAVGFGIFGALTKDAEAKNKDGELTKGQKVKNFIRHNCGKLAFASMIPVLAEEGMASLRGNSWAKEFLNLDLAKKVCKNNRIAYISYFATAAGLGLAARAAVYVKDKMIDKKEA